MFIVWLFLEFYERIETAFMWYGHGPNEIISITLKPWAYSMHTCSRIVQDTTNMSDHSGKEDVTSQTREATAHHFGCKG